MNDELRVIDALAEMLERLFVGYTLLNTKGVLQQVRVYKQFLPQPKGMAVTEREKSGLEHYGEDDFESNFPCVIVKYEGHTDAEERRLEQSRTTMRLLLGVVDMASECTGYRDILDMTSRIRQEVLMNRVLGERFMLQMPLKSRLVSADTWPVYFGEIELVYDTGRYVMGKDFVTKGAIGQ